jgi:2,3-bisphosphoglycerate-dependent phosphoglycerate mutase
MRNVYVVVHPESTHHQHDIVGGWHDSELTPAGMADASEIARAIAEQIPRGSTSEVYSSDLRRTHAVATKIGAALDVPVISDPGFREKSYGEAEGRPQVWLDERFIPPPATGDRMGHREGVAGSETKREFATRIYAAVDRALTSDVEHTVIVTHGFALTFVVAAWSRLPLDALGYMNLRCSAGSITTLKEDDYFHNRQVVRLDSTEHLGRMQAAPRPAPE